MLFLLIVQFFLGMSMNLFAAPPTDPKFASEPIFIKLIFPSHIAVAVLLLVDAIYILIASVKNKIANLRKVAGQGLSSIVLAVGGGLVTIFLTGIASEVASLVMAISFLSAFIAYGRLHYLLQAKN
jgi:hypothetical protein